MKKGFTLIEIIICITLITIIGVGSFIGVKLVNDKIKTTKLEQITDKAIEAAQVYIETDKQSYNELYSNQNGVSIPIKLLVDEGLLDISNTTLEDKDLKDEYVVTFLGGSGGAENCEQITSSASWANDKPLYLCMRSDGTGANLAVIDPNKVNNTNAIKASFENYYFKGPGAQNYIKINNQGYRILYITADDSIVVYKTLYDSRRTDASFPTDMDEFKDVYGVTDNLFDKIPAISNGNTICDVVNYSENGTTIIKGEMRTTEYNLSFPASNKYLSAVTCEDVANTSISNGPNSNTFTTFIKSYYIESDSWKFKNYSYGGSELTYNNVMSRSLGYPYQTQRYINLKAKLKFCVKINGGIGTRDNPYTVDSSKC